MKRPVPGLKLAAELQNFVATRVFVAYLIALVLGAFAAGLAVGGGLIPAAAAAIAGLTMFIVVFLAVAIAMLGRRGRAIVEGTLWLAEDEKRRWRERTGSTWVPRKPAQARRWLAENPAADRNRSERVAAWLLAGDVDAARVEQRARRAESTADRVEATLEEWFIEVWIGGDPPLEMGDSLVEQVMDEPRRARMQRELLLLRCMDSAYRGVPWQPGTVELRALIGAEADGYLWRRFWPMVAAGAVLLYTLGFGLVWVIVGVD